MDALLTLYCEEQTLSLSVPLQPVPIPRHVILPKDLAKGLPKSRVLSEQEWRGLGVQQSRGWMHYAIHRCEKAPAPLYFSSKPIGSRHFRSTYPSRDGHERCL